MRGTSVWMGGALLLAACGGGSEQAVPADTTAAPPAAAPAPAPVAVDSAVLGSPQLTFTAVGGSALTGDARVIPRGAQVEVMLLVDGAPANAELPAHIHRGRCGADQGVAAALDPVRVDAQGSGGSNTTAAVPADSAMNGQHYLQVHVPGGAPALCLDIPAAN